jgi:hypothetical protein
MLGSETNLLVLSRTTTCDELKCDKIINEKAVSDGEGVRKSDHRSCFSPVYQEVTTAGLMTPRGLKFRDKKASPPTRKTHGVNR